MSPHEHSFYWVSGTKLCIHCWHTPEETLDMENKYFRFIDEEAALDREFEQELKTRLPQAAGEVADWFEEKNGVTLDRARCMRLARLLRHLVAALPKDTNEEAPAH